MESPSRDPIGYEAGANFYAYVLAHPLDATDPSGLIPPDNTNPKKDPSSRWPYTGGPRVPPNPKVPRSPPLPPGPCDFDLAKSTKHGHVSCGRWLIWPPAYICISNCKCGESLSGLYYIYGCPHVSLMIDCDTFRKTMEPGGGPIPGPGDGMPPDMA